MAANDGPCTGLKVSRPVAHDVHPASSISATCRYCRKLLRRLRIGGGVEWQTSDSTLEQLKSQRGICHCDPRGGVVATHVNHCLRL